MDDQQEIEKIIRDPVLFPNPRQGMEFSVEHHAQCICMSRNMVIDRKTRKERLERLEALSDAFRHFENALKKFSGNEKELISEDFSSDELKTFLAHAHLLDGHIDESLSLIRNLEKKASKRGPDTSVEDSIAVAVANAYEDITGKAVNRGDTDRNEQCSYKPFLGEILQYFYSYADSKALENRKDSLAKKIMKRKTQPSKKTLQSRNPKKS